MKQLYACCNLLTEIFTGDYEFVRIYKDYYESDIQILNSIKNNRRRYTLIPL